MKNFLVFVVAVLGILAAAPNTSQAQGFTIGFGDGPGYYAPGITRQVFMDTRTMATNTTIPGTDIITTTDAFTILSPTIEATITALVIDITSGGITTGRT